MDNYSRYTCIALLPLSQEQIDDDIRMRTRCGKKADLIIILEHDQITSFGSYISAYFCLDHIPQLKITKIN